MSANSCSLEESFQRRIPTSIQNEIKIVVDNTKRTEREQSLTFCRLENKDNLFISDYSSGSKFTTDVMPCDEMYGESVRIGDLHTHPTMSENVVGITPSQSDIVSTILDSSDSGVPLISCITGPDADHIHCYQPKTSVIKDREKIKNYEKISDIVQNGLNGVSPYLREHVAEDLIHAWYNRRTFKRVNPTASEILKDAFIHSKKGLKFDNLDDMEKGVTCDLVEDLNLPGSGVAEKCRQALHIRNLFGFRY